MDDGRFTTTKYWNYVVHIQRLLMGRYGMIMEGMHARRNNFILSDNVQDVMVEGVGSAHESKKTWEIFVNRFE